MSYYKQLFEKMQQPEFEEEIKNKLNELSKYKSTVIPSSVSGSEYLTNYDLGKQVNDYDNLLGLDSKQENIQPSEPVKSEINEPIIQQGTVDQLRQVQDDRNNQLFYNQLGRIGSSIGRLIARAPESKEDSWKDLDTLAEKQVADYKDRVNQEQTDPNSSTSKLYRDVLSEKLKMKFPESASAKDLEKFISSSSLSPFKQLELEIALQKLGLSKKGLELRDKSLDLSQQAESRKEKTFEWKKTEADELTPKQTESIIELDDTITKLEDAFNMKKLFSTGPIESRVATFKREIGQDDASRTAFKAKVNRFASSYIKSLSGLTVSDKERESLLSSIPTDQMSDESFLKTYEDFLKDLEKFKSTKLEGYRRSGRNIKEHIPKNIGIESDSKVKVKSQNDILPKKTVIRKGYNPTTNQTRFIYSDGTKEIVEGKK